MAETRRSVQEYLDTLDDVNWPNAAVPAIVFLTKKRILDADTAQI
jgi:hypothetical protein